MKEAKAFLRGKERFKKILEQAKREFETISDCGISSRQELRKIVRQPTVESLTLRIGSSHGKSINTRTSRSAPFGAGLLPRRLGEEMALWQRR
jgi:hypothetical protein